MPKLKTHKGVARRMRVTGTGKMTRRKSGRRHLMNGKSGKKGRGLRRPAAIPSVAVKQLRRLLPYG